MTEGETLRLVQAFVLTLITFALPFQATRKTEIENIDKLIRIAYKAALQLPNRTSTDRLMSIGINNTYEELAAATLIAQRERLNTTHQGRKLLQRLGYTLTPNTSEMTQSSYRCTYGLAPSWNRSPKTCMRNTTKSADKREHEKSSRKGTIVILTTPTLAFTPQHHKAPENRHTQR
ncbi:hypothetical protein HPB49_020001 [Dermacentor silvarum]|uniref:Uncharacterized protein n=1 Tax=Dermacentor silvarum TaxID=543639 RepID=A0ACB8C585_DERSI|nr:hypothetical protein HPB49_020001 [Dermacentor silvarum]